MNGTTVAKLVGAALGIIFMSHFVGGMWLVLGGASLVLLFLA